MRRKVLAGLLSLVQVTLCQADVSNTAALSFRDASGLTHTNPSNSVLISILRRPVVSRFERLAPTMTPDDTIGVVIENGFEEVLWSLSQEDGLVSGAPSRSRQRVVSQRVTTRTPFLRLGDAPQVRSGRWHIAVAAANAAGMSEPLEADVQVVAADLGTVRVYPNPWRESRDAGSPVRFEGLPVNADVKIFSVSGRLVKELGTVSGATTWDLRNQGGDHVSAGIYLWLITDARGGRSRGKLVIIR